MVKIDNPPKDKWEALLKRPRQEFETIETTVIEIFKEVQTKKDKAISKYTKLFDGCSIADSLVSQDEIKQASDQVAKPLKAAIEVAKKNIEMFHSIQKRERIAIETTKGVYCWQEQRPIEKVGLYIPGGTAPLFSTVLMLAIPAKLAGCSEIVICTPPDASGQINPAILYAASMCKVDKIYKIGGIQAIAAMTFGSETVEKVSKIVGPGNQFVTVAKQVATKFGVAIDMPAGPSELLIVCDHSANASFIASDLLSQAEHGVDSQVILVSTSKPMRAAVLNELEKQLKDLPRKDVAKQSLKNSKFIYLKRDEEAIALINNYGPEHFIICTENEEFYINNIRNAGSVFIGNYTPESAGDYASGTNHTLPTNGFSKAYSGLGLDSFLKRMTFQKITKEGIRNLGETIEIMAEAEGLYGHKNAITLRLNSLENDKV